MLLAIVISAFVLIALIAIIYGIALIARKGEEVGLSKGAVWFISLCGTPILGGIVVAIYAIDYNGRAQRKDTEDLIRSISNIEKDTATKSMPDRTETKYTAVKEAVSKSIAAENPESEDFSDARYKWLASVLISGDVAVDDIASCLRISPAEATNMKRSVEYFFEHFPEREKISKNKTLNSYDFAFINADAPKEVQVPIHIINMLYDIYASLPYYNILDVIPIEHIENISRILNLPKSKVQNLIKYYESHPDKTADELSRHFALPQSEVHYIVSFVGNYTKTEADPSLQTDQPNA